MTKIIGTVDESNLVGQRIWPPLEDDRRAPALIDMRRAPDEPALTRIDPRSKKRELELLREENRKLRALVVQLSDIVLRNVVERA